MKKFFNSLLGNISDSKVYSTNDVDHHDYDVVQQQAKRTVEQVRLYFPFRYVQNIWSNTLYIDFNRTKLAKSLIRKQTPNFNWLHF